jgi:hypothetical protein
LGFRVYLYEERKQEEEGSSREVRGVLVSGMGGERGVEEIGGYAK